MKQDPIPNLMEATDAETIVIGFLLSTVTLEESEIILSNLDIDCFHNPQLKLTFQAMTELANQGSPCSLGNVYLQLNHFHPDTKVDSRKLADWLDAARTQNLDLSISILKDYKVRRNLQIVAHRLIAKAKDDNAPLAEAVNEAINLLDAQDVTSQHPSKSLHDIVPELRQRIDDNRNPDTRHHGPYIGLDEIDNCGGLSETGLVVLAGGTSSGKSSVAAGILLHSADQGMKGLYISLEMPNDSLVGRMTAMRGHGLSARDMLVHPLTKDEEFYQAIGDLQEIDRRYGEMIYFDDSRTINLDDICSTIRYLTRTRGIRVVVVDFVQLLNFNMQNRAQQLNIEQQMGTAARRLKNLADRLGICVVMVSQLNRTMDRQRPTMGSVRDSGQIAEAADMLILTWRPEQYKGQYDQDLAKYSPTDTMALLVVKNREGATQDIIAHWDGKRTLMRQLTSFERLNLIDESRPQLFTGQ